MSNELQERLNALAWKINRELDRIHAEAIVVLLSQARATGQRTRLDRVAGAKRQGG